MYPSIVLREVGIEKYLLYTLYQRDLGGGQGFNLKRKDFQFLQLFKEPNNIQHVYFIVFKLIKI